MKAHRNSAATILPRAAAADAPLPRVYGQSPFPVGEPLPGVLYLADLAAILGVKMSRAYDLQARNELMQFEMRPRIGGIARYSGVKVQRWLEGDDAASTTRRFFASAR